MLSGLWKPDGKGAGQGNEPVTGEPSVKTDILVVGTGAAGLSTAIALAQSGFAVVASGALDTVSNGRTVALFEGSLRFFRALNLGPDLPIKQPKSSRSK